MIDSCDVKNFTLQKKKKMERKGGRAGKTGVGETESRMASQCLRGRPRGSPKVERLFFILDGARETDPGDSELPVRGAPSARPHFGHVVDGGGDTAVPRSTHLHFRGTRSASPKWVCLRVCAFRRE